MFFVLFRFVFRFVLEASVGPGGGFGGFPVNSKSSGKATTGREQKPIKKYMLRYFGLFLGVSTWE